MDHGPLPRDHLRPGGFGDQIYQAADNGEITHEQAPMLVRSFLSAGVDTTINGIGNTLFAWPIIRPNTRSCTPNHARAPGLRGSAALGVDGSDLLPHRRPRHRDRRRNGA